MKNKNNIKKVTYIFLSLASTIFFDSDLAFGEELEIPVKGGNVKVLPIIKKSETDDWKELSFIGPKNFPKTHTYSSKKDRKGEIYTDTNYADIKDKIIDKYKDQNPGIVKYKTSSYSGRISRLNLGPNCEEFYKSARELGERLKKENDDYSGMLKSILNTGEVTIKSLQDKFLGHNNVNKETSNSVSNIKQSLFNLID